MISFYIFAEKFKIYIGKCNLIMIVDEFSEYYKDLLDGTYDCIDRIVLNAYFSLANSCGGLRCWWLRLYENVDKLNNTQLMKFAGRFSRRIHAYAEKNQIPLIHCTTGDRKYEIAKEYIPTSTSFRGLFCILSSRAHAPTFNVSQSSNGAPHISKKIPRPYVKHYSFHIKDPEWGHIVIKLCPHPPFNAQIILNGHEYAANQAEKKKLSFTKEDNCFTNISDAADFVRIADTMKAESFVGRLVQVCERWIYSTCLCFALEIVEQERTGFRYSYSVYQVEYSRNLLFTRGHTMDQIFQSIIDRTRASLNIKSLKTIFGYKHRPFKKANSKNNRPRFEVSVERPVYDLTVFKVHFGKLTVKIYSKGERVLRIEVVAHNTKDLKCGRSIINFPRIITSLKDILERFLSVLRSVDISFIDSGTFENWPLPSKIACTRVGGINVNQYRIRTVMKAVIALSINPRGFTASELAYKVREIMGCDYSSRQASYDLKKFRGKELVSKIYRSHRYEASTDGLRTMSAFIVLREKVLIPLLAPSEKPKTDPKPRNRCEIDIHYDNMRAEMKKIFEALKIAA